MKNWLKPHKKASLFVAVPEGLVDFCLGSDDLRFLGAFLSRRVGQLHQPADDVGEKKSLRENQIFVDGRMYFYRRLEDLGIVGVVFFLKDELFLRIACAGAFPRLWSNMLRCQEGLLPKHT